MKKFQSTPPVKAATDDNTFLPKEYIISIHAAREGGDTNPPPVSLLSCISIHAAREGGDCEIWRRRCG